MSVPVCDEPHGLLAKSRVGTAPRLHFGKMVRSSRRTRRRCGMNAKRKWNLVECPGFSCHSGRKERG